MFLDTMIVRRYYGNLTHIAGNPQHLHDFEISQAAKSNKHGHLLDETTQLSISKKSNPNVNFRMLQKAARSRMLLPQHGKETFHDVVCLIYQPLVRIPLLEFFHTTQVRSPLNITSQLFMSSKTFFVQSREIDDGEIIYPISSIFVSSNFRQLS